MSLQLKVSNSLSHLAAELSQKYHEEASSVFTPGFIVTQTDGMNIWLKQQMVLHLGIVAHTQFLKPNDVILKVYSILGGVFERSISKENLIWIIYRILGEPSFQKRYPIQAAYFLLEGKVDEMKKMGLAEKMADLFDQYQIFRPEFIKEWNEPNTDDSLENWQAYLWFNSKKIAASQLPDKTILRDFILLKLEDKSLQEKLRNAMPVLYLFGLSILTKFHISLITAIAEVVDVHFYLQNPAPEIYWLDDRSEKEVSTWRQRGAPNTESQIIGNRLLTNWGKVLRNTFSLLFKNEELLNHYEVINTEAILPITLLSKIQEDIYNNKTDNRNTIEKQDLADETVVVQSCYTIAREVDALYQYLVHLVDKKKESLSSRDIVVMVSDINLYAPFIMAVFENAPYRFKFKIADNSIDQVDHLLIALEQILLLNDENFTSENVLKLVEMTTICQRFGFSDIAKIRKMVAAANIRFGINGNQNDETEFVSWQYGLKRIMFGICMSGEKEYIGTTDLYPLDLIEGNDSQEMIRFCHFVQVLISSIEDRKKQRSLAEWVLYITELIGNLLVDKEQLNTSDSQGYSAVLGILENYAMVEDYMPATISYEIFIRNFLLSVRSESNTGLYFNDGITFCSLVPMRSIPFKVVAMLGMGFASFPRQEKKINFNLITKKPQLGDRNIKDSDKHLFLETLLSAQKYFYLSYLGKSISDNSDLPPSVLIDELLDYIQSGLKKEIDLKEKFVVQQPLHHFSTRYNADNKMLYRYTTEGLRKLNTVFLEEKELVQIDTSEIKFNSVLSFYKNSPKVFLQKRLNVYFDDEDIVIPETELFSLNGLESWALKNELLHNDSPLEVSRKRWVLKGKLPLKGIADLVLNDLNDEIAPYQYLFQKHTGSIALKALPFQIVVDNSLLFGELNNVYHQKIVCVSFSKRILKVAVECYLQALVGIASQNVQSLVIIFGKEMPEEYNADLRGISVVEAQNRLTAIIQFYKKGLSNFIPFFDFFYPYLIEEREWTAEELKDKLYKKFNDFSFPIDDQYLIQAKELALFDQVDFLENLMIASELVLKPLLQIFPNLPKEKN